MGSPSEIVKSTTEGSKPADSPASGDRFITVNVSWIILHLHMWNDGGCPITFFELEYKRSGEELWTLVSNNIEVSASIFFIFTLINFHQFKLKISMKIN